MSNYEFHYSRLVSDDGVNMLLATILEEFIGEQITNDQVSIYRWVQTDCEETIMELIFKYEYRQVSQNGYTGGKILVWRENG